MLQIIWGTWDLWHRSTASCMLTTSIYCSNQY